MEELRRRLRRRHDLERFDTHFERTRDGTILYRPPGAPVGLPLAPFDHADLRERFVRRHRLDTVLRWAALVGGLFVGYRKWDATHSLLEFALPALIGAGAAFLLGLKTHLSLLDPLEQERVALAKRNAVSRTVH